MPSFLITQRFGDPQPLLFRDLDDRAGKGRIGFLGGGVRMLATERAEFESMLAEGRTRHIGISKVFDIVTDPVTDAERAQAFTVAFRDAMLQAADACCDQYMLTYVADTDLPALFKTLDALAEQLWWRRPTPREIASRRPSTAPIAAELRAAGAANGTVEPRP